MKKQLKLAFMFLLVWIVSGVVFACTSSASGGTVTVSDSTLTITEIARVSLRPVYRVDDHVRGVTCYYVYDSGMDCDRSFYERR